MKYLHKIIICIYNINIMIEIAFLVSGLYWSYLMYDFVRIPEDEE